MPDYEFRDFQSKVRRLEREKRDRETSLDRKILEAADAEDSGGSEAKIQAIGSLFGNFATAIKDVAAWSDRARMVRAVNGVNLLSERTKNKIDLGVLDLGKDDDWKLLLTDYKTELGKLGTNLGISDISAYAQDQIDRFYNYADGARLAAVRSNGIYQATKLLEDNSRASSMSETLSTPAGKQSYDILVNYLGREKADRKVNDVTSSNIQKRARDVTIPINEGLVKDMDRMGFSPEEKEAVILTHGLKSAESPIVYDPGPMGNGEVLDIKREIYERFKEKFDLKTAAANYEAEIDSDPSISPAIKSIKRKIVENYAKGTAKYIGSNDLNSYFNLWGEGINLDPKTQPPEAVAMDIIAASEAGLLRNTAEPRKGFADNSHRVPSAILNRASGGDRASLETIKSAVRLAGERGMGDFLFTTWEDLSRKPDFVRAFVYGANTIDDVRKVRRAKEQAPDVFGNLKNLEDMPLGRHLFTRSLKGAKKLLAGDENFRAIMKFNQELLAAKWPVDSDKITLADTLKSSGLKIVSFGWFNPLYTWAVGDEQTEGVRLSKLPAWMNFEYHREVQESRRGESRAWLNDFFDPAPAPPHWFVVGAPRAWYKRLVQDVTAHSGTPLETLSPFLSSELPGTRINLPGTMVRLGPYTYTPFTDSGETPLDPFTGRPFVFNTREQSSLIRNK